MALWIMAAAGFQANVAQAPATLFWMQMLMSVVPAAITLLAAAAVLLYRIDGPMEREMAVALQEIKPGRMA
jgi:glycoside/pentoside/hexuronide:cation symporter, GPH family